jgi:hypothetical protein
LQLLYTDTLRKAEAQTHNDFQPPPQPHKSYKLLRSIASQLLLLLAVVGAGSWVAAAGQTSLQAAEELDKAVSSLVQQFVNPEDRPDSFDVNSAVAALADRGEYGLCAAEVVDMLPHDTPGSYSWQQKRVVAELREASWRSRMLRLWCLGVLQA